MYYRIECNTGQVLIRLSGRSFPFPFQSISEVFDDLVELGIDIEMILDRKKLNFIALDKVTALS